MTCPSPSARTCRTPRRPAAGTAAAGVRCESRHSAPRSHRSILSRLPSFSHTLPHLQAAPSSRAVTSPPPPGSQDHQVFAQHNNCDTLLVLKDFVNTSKEWAVVTTRMAAKAAAKQVAAEHAETKQKTEVKKAMTTKEVAEDAAPAQATKEEAPVHAITARHHQ